MKKTILILLTCAMLFAAAGCTANTKIEEAPMHQTFQVGFGRVNITPDDPVPLAGYGNTNQRISSTVLDYLYATCIAITDTSGETLLLYSQDLVNSSQTETVRSAVSATTGIPTENIMVAATHTHSAPDQSSTHENITFWKLDYVNKMVEAAEAALADRSDAEIMTGRAETKQLNFIRHYELSDGSYGGSNFGDFNKNTIVGYATENDPVLQVIKFQRAAEDKKDIILVNWQAHPLMTGGLTKPDISADFIGSTRSYLEEKTDGLFAYFTGAAGNHNPHSRISGDERTRDYKLYGQYLGEYVLEALENMTKQETGDIAVNRQMYACNINHDMEDKLDDAKKVSELYHSTDRDTGNVLARELGFSSVYHADAVLRRAKLEQTRDVELNTVAIGGISFIAAPYEMFSNHGQYIKENTPFDMTFVISCCNGVNGYIPSTDAYDYGCYESHTGNFARETGDELAEEYVSMLNQLKNGGK